MTTVLQILEHFNNINPSVKLTPYQIQEVIIGYIEHEKEMLEQAFYDGRERCPLNSFESWYNAKT